LDLEPPAPSSNHLTSSHLQYLPSYLPYLFNCLLINFLLISYLAKETALIQPITKLAVPFLAILRGISQEPATYKLKATPSSVLRNQYKATILLPEHAADTRSTIPSGA
jgi:hypothetical protein